MLHKTQSRSASDEASRASIPLTVMACFALVWTNVAVKVRFLLSKPALDRHAPCPQQVLRGLRRVRYIRRADFEVATQSNLPFHSDARGLVFWLEIDIADRHPASDRPVWHELRPSALLEAFQARRVPQGAAAPRLAVAAPVRPAAPRLAEPPRAKAAARRGCKPLMDPCLEHRVANTGANGDDRIVGQNSSSPSG
jgi:hypothetical protein